jgi:hypothetical protein
MLLVHQALKSMFAENGILSNEERTKPRNAIIHISWPAAGAILDPKTFFSASELKP